MVTGTAWVVRSEVEREVVLAVAHSTCAGPPLGNRLCACAQSGDLALEGCISSLTGSLPLGHEGRGQASPVVHSWQPRSKARGPGQLWCGWEAVLKLRARTKDAGPTLNVLQLPAPKVN